MNDCILLKSYGRAGSHLIVDWFLNIGYKWFDTEIQTTKYIEKHSQKAKKVIIKDHSIDYIPNIKISKVIILERKDQLAQALSELVAQRTQRWVAPYDNKKFKPFTIHEKKVLGEIKYINRSNRARIKLCRKLKLNYEILYYEDFSNDPTSLVLKLGLENDLTSWTRQPSPYRPAELILNYQEIKLAYHNSLL